MLHVLAIIGFSSFIDTSVIKTAMCSRPAAIALTAWERSVYTICTNRRVDFYTNDFEYFLKKS